MDDILVCTVWAYTGLGVNQVIHDLSSHPVDRPGWVSGRAWWIPLFTWPAMSIAEHRFRYGRTARSAIMGLADALLDVIVAGVGFYVVLVGILALHLHNIGVVVLMNLLAVAVGLFVWIPIAKVVSSVLFVVLYYPFNIIFPYRRRSGTEPPAR